MRKHITLLFILACAVYAATLFNDFMWDDRVVVQSDPLVMNNDIKGLFSLDYWTSVPAQQRDRFRPLRTASFIIDNVIYSGKPYGFHITNMLLNAFTVVLLYLFVSIVFKNNTAALIAAALFAVHPVHVETVAWVKNRSDLFCAIFMFSGLIAFIKTRGFWRWAAVSAAFIGAAMSKEVAVVYPVMLWLTARFYLPEEERKHAYYIIAWTLVMAVAVFVAKEMFWRKEILAEQHLMLDAYLQTRIVLYTISTYLTLFVYPFNLAVERPMNYDVATLQAAGPGFVVFAVLAVLILSGYLYFRKHPVAGMNELFRNAGFSYLLMLAALLPVSNIVLIDARPIAEQRLYIPSIGFVLMAGVLLSALLRLLGSKALSFRFGAVSYVNIALALVIGAGAFLSVNRTFVWKDDITFWTETVKASPMHYRANFNLGLIYMGRGDVDKAIPCLERASKDCDRFEVYNYLARCYDDRGRYQDSVNTYLKFVNNFPNVSPDVVNNLGVAYEKNKDLKNAEKCYRKALEAEVENMPARLNLARVYELKGMQKKAVREYKTIIGIGSPTANEQALSIASAKLAELRRGK